MFLQREEFNPSLSIAVSVLTVDGLSAARFVLIQSVCGRRTQYTHANVKCRMRSLVQRIRTQAHPHAQCTSIGMNKLKYEVCSVKLIEIGFRLVSPFTQYATHTHTPSLSFVIRFIFSFVRHSFACDRTKSMRNNATCHLLARCLTTAATATATDDRFVVSELVFGPERTRHTYAFIPF